MKLALSSKLQTRLRLPDAESPFFSPLPLHIAGAVALLALNVYLILHMAFAYGSLHRNNDDAMVQQTSAMTAAEIAARPLRGLDRKVAIAENDQASFYVDRLPTAYSTVAGNLGDLAKKNNVRLTRVQYTENPGLGGSPQTALTEVHMDATLSGDYRPLMQFLNGLERSRSFFLITGVTLSGQQTGTVNLRMRLLTYLRAPNAGEKVDLAPSSGDTDTDAPPAPAPPAPRRTGAKR